MEKICPVCREPMRVTSVNEIRDYSLRVIRSEPIDWYCECQDRLSPEELNEAERQYDREQRGEG